MLIVLSGGPYNGQTLRRDCEAGASIRCDGGGYANPGVYVVSGDVRRSSAGMAQVATWEERPADRPAPAAAAGADGARRAG